MSGEVRGDSFFDAENLRNLLQVLIILSIADNRQDIAARALLLVFAQYRQRNIEQFDLRRHARLHTMRLNPGAAIVSQHDILWR